MVRKSHFKRVTPLIAKVSLRTIGHDFLYPRDWEADQDAPQARDASRR